MRNEQSMCHSCFWMFMVKLISHSWVHIVFHLQAAPPGGKNWYRGLVQLKAQFQIYLKIFRVKSEFEATIMWIQCVYSELPVRRDCSVYCLFHILKLWNWCSTRLHMWVQVSSYSKKNSTSFFLSSCSYTVLSDLFYYYYYYFYFAHYREKKVPKQGNKFQVLLRISLVSLQLWKWWTHMFVGIAAQWWWQHVKQHLLKVFCLTVFLKQKSKKVK